MTISWDSPDASQRTSDDSARISRAMGIIDRKYWILACGDNPDNPEVVADSSDQHPGISLRYVDVARHKLVCPGCAECQPGRA